MNTGPVDVEPALTNNCPLVPAPKKLVAPALVWNGICPVVPAVRLVAVVIVPLIDPNIVPPTYKLPPIPTPPTTCNAPVAVDVAEAVDDTDTVPVELTVIRTVSLVAI